jgi:predicted  nucleic acid-binding Zn-ribbon protein
METKEELVNNIKEWIKIDNEIMKLQNEIKERKNKKKTLSESLMNVMKKNEIDCFDINGGALLYKKNKVKKPINAKNLMSVLQNYYKNDQKQAEDLTKHIMENREEQIKETIRRKIDKS